MLRFSFMGENSRAQVVWMRWKSTIDETGKRYWCQGKLVFDPFIEAVKRFPRADADRVTLRARLRAGAIARMVLAHKNMCIEL